VVLTKRKTTW